MSGRKACECRCGVMSCGRSVGDWSNERCALDYLDCIAQHPMPTCGHVWDGEAVDIEGGWSATCSRCGMSSFSHDMRFAP